MTLIAEAVKDELNAATLSMAFTAERLYVPTFRLKDMKTLHVTVVARSWKEEPLDRGGVNTMKYAVDVGIQKKLTAVEPAEIDPLMLLSQDVAKHFNRKVLATTPKAIYVSAENNPVFSQEHMDQLRQFTSVVTLNFRVLAA